MVHSTELAINRRGRGKYSLDTEPRTQYGRSTDLNPPIGTRECMRRQRAARSIEKPDVGNPQVRCEGH